MRYFFVGFLTILFSSEGTAQVVDPEFVEAAEKKALAVYRAATQHRDLIFNGTEYYPFDGSSDGFPYYFSEYAEEEGRVVYDGEVYTDIPILYDLVRDQLVVENYDQSGHFVTIQLDKRRVQSFAMAGKNFVHLTPDEPGVIRDGYYALLFDGNLRVYARHRKTEREEISMNSVQTSFDEKVNYYLWKGGQYFDIKTKSSLLKLLADEKKRLREYANRMRLDFVNDREGSLISMVQYYDQLKGQR